MVGISIYLIIAFIVFIGLTRSKRQLYKEIKKRAEANGSTFTHNRLKLATNLGIIITSFLWIIAIIIMIVEMIIDVFKGGGPTGTAPVT